MPLPPLPTQVTCPKCGVPFITQLRTVIDVGDEPALKDEFLRGRVNYAQCPQCHAGGLLSAPLLYHDPAKELLISYVPAQLAMTAQQQEQYVGALVNAVMDRLPPEQRKAYFLQPRAALTLEGLFDTILEADGISKEALEAQRARVKLINELMAVVDDEQALARMVEENRAKLDYEFYLTLSGSIEAHEQDGDEEGAARLTGLREKLLARASPALPQMPRAGSYDQLIEQLQATTTEDRWRALVAVNRQSLDYGFFQALTGRIEAAQAAGDQQTEQSLTELRKRILDELDAQDKMVRFAEDQASLLIMKLAEAPDLPAAVREHRKEVNQVFLSVLSRYQAMATTQKDEARAAKLGQILQAALDMLEENLPPQDRLINRLLRADYPDGTNAVLESHRGLLNNEFLQACDEVIAQLQGGADKDLAEHLKQVRGQIVAKMTILRA